ncbi:guanylate kinase [bacterium]|nr:guanylate kinase [bacterium]
MKPKLFVIAGPSGVGKGTIIKDLLSQNDNLTLSVSSTTRQPRPGEADGINYNFLNQEQFKTAIENGEFLEWAVYNNNYYGTKKSAVEDALNIGKSIILEIEIQGALQIMEKCPDAVFIFILPPSYEELEKRLRGRNTEDEQTIQNRLKITQKELEIGKKFKYSVVNNKVDEAVEKILEIVNKECEC